MTALRIANKPELLARTLTMLSETVERYDLFADQMEVVNNPQAAEIFRWLEQKQRERTQVVQDLSEGLALPHIPPWDYHWDDAINIEVPGHASAHYMMTPYHTLTLAIDVEQSAADLFDNIERDTELPEVRKLAHGFAREANAFCDYLKQKREHYPLPQAGWDEDEDPPQFLE
ncbi:hypothetical protein [Sedimenticola hydrogenitrophicus]|uniref:hypothetical protein n=1 Tax=Sedimenticola hydrogenitrophicus TaxID=2967975 RepID=UPI0023AE941C|nr:hypothetical protein [Sedimenticola hydrogenitrophicus]